MQRLFSYFTDGIASETLQTIGAEVETQFVNAGGQAIQAGTSQKMLEYLTEHGWRVDCRKGNLITTLSDQQGNKIFYELGRHNIEVSTIATTPTQIFEVTQNCLAELYKAAQHFGTRPFHSPILYGDEDLLIIPDERDAIWLELDGRSALAPLARTSSVQFTFSVSVREAMKILNQLGRNIDLFMTDYPQDAVWKQYIADSSAKYRFDRYGGPLRFNSLEDYCQLLSTHDVVQGSQLVPFKDVSNLDIPLFLRSIWWHFRLKRYGDSLCIEVRPLARRTDDHIQVQLEQVLALVNA